jgi:1,4-dihydroxy-2-naphthoate octaprenyltransferase
MRWWQVFNPAIYLISILPAIALLLIAGQVGVWMNGLIISTLAVILLQHSINLFNDVSDWDLGADAEKMDSWVRFFDGRTGPVKTHALISFVVGGVIGLCVLFISDKLWIVFIALPLVVLGYLYNAGKSPLSYTWMGEWVTGICYGGVFGCLWLVTGLELNFSAVLGIVAIAALAMSLLLSHQSPQFETDRKVGKKSFCVRYGVKKTKQVSVWLFSLSLVCIAIGASFSQVVPNLQYVVFLLIIAFSLYLSKVGPNPKRVLILSSALLLCMAMLTLFTQYEEVLIL